MSKVAITQQIRFGIPALWVQYGCFCSTDNTEQLLTGFHHKLGPERDIPGGEEYVCLWGLKTEDDDTLLVWLHVDLGPGAGMAEFVAVSALATCTMDATLVTTVRGLRFLLSRFVYWCCWPERCSSGLTRDFIFRSHHCELWFGETRLGPITAAFLSNTKNSLFCGFWYWYFSSEFRTFGI